MAATVTNTNPVVDVGLGGGHDGTDFRFSPARYRVGVWVAIASIVMLFTALASAYIVRSASAEDWVPVQMPKVLWLSTAAIFISSVTIEISRRSLKRKGDAQYGMWLTITAVLGVVFVASQYLAWRHLAGQGVYVASNPHSSFFYLFTGAHAIHVLGGLGALAYLLMRTRRKSATVEGELKRIGAVDAATTYWHFLDGLWICLFLLLFFWR